MKRFEFDACLEEAKKMFNLKDISPYVADVFFDEFSNVEKKIFLRAMANAAAYGHRFTLDNIFEGVSKAMKDVPREVIDKTNCTRCGGNGAVIANGFAYSCTCSAGDNYPNYPKYNFQNTNYLKVEEKEDHYLRTFGDYKVTVKKGARSAKDVTFTIGDL